MGLSKLWHHVWSALLLTPYFVFICFSAIPFSIYFEAYKRSRVFLNRNFFAFWALNRWNKKCHKVDFELKRFFLFQRQKTPRVKACRAYLRMGGKNTIASSVSHGCGQVVSVLAFFCDDPSSNPADAYSFFCKSCFKRPKINKKEAGVCPFSKNSVSRLGYFLNILARIFITKVAQKFGDF